MITSPEVKRTRENKGLPENKGNRNVQKEKLKKKFPVLMDKYLMSEIGKRDTMSRKFQVKLGNSQEELHKIVGAL